MPSKWVQQCPGYATYRWHEDGSIEVDGEGFWTYDLGGKQAENIRTFWNKYGKMFLATAGELGLPVAWVVGIVFVESRGDEWGCSPCEPKTCPALYPNCGGGVAKDGKHYVCCAYGLMQVIEVNAKHYGFKSGADLLGNPTDSIRVGCKIYKSNLNASKGDPLVAVRRYNGCSKTTCVGGRITNCNPSCPFGVGGQNGYALKFAKSVNTFLALDLGDPSGYDPARIEESRASMGALGWAAIIGGSLALSYLAAKHWPRGGR